MSKTVVVGRLMDDALKQQVLEHLGDPAAISDELAELREMAIRMDAEHSELLCLYPDKWVAMSKDGNIGAAASTMDALFQKLDKKRVSYKDVVHGYMDTSPRSMLL